MILLECNGCNRVMHLPDSEAEFLDRDEPRCPSCRKRQAERVLGQFVEVPKDTGPVASSVLIFAAGVIMVIVAMLSGCGETSYQVCMKNGYPKVDYVFGTAYCRRQVLGTDEVVPADKLRGQAGAP